MLTSVTRNDLFLSCSLLVDAFTSVKYLYLMLLYKIPWIIKILFDLDPKKRELFSWSLIYLYFWLFIFGFTFNYLPLCIHKNCIRKTLLTEFVCPATQVANWPLNRWWLWNEGRMAMAYNQSTSSTGESILFGGQ